MSPYMPCLMNMCMSRSVKGSRGRSHILSDTSQIRPGEVTKFRGSISYHSMQFFLKFSNNIIVEHHYKYIDHDTDLVFEYGKTVHDYNHRSWCVCLTTCVKKADLGGILSSSNFWKLSTYSFGYTPFCRSRWISWFSCCSVSRWSELCSLVVEKSPNPC